MHASHLGWSVENGRGVELAAHGEWSAAAEAFSAASDALADAHAEQGTHDALALVLGNLANATFRAGRTDDAIVAAQRACALRVALLGEDAIAVARCRSDLAVMLSAGGRSEEASALLSRAIAGIERSVGDEDLRLVPLLENAARVALTMAHAASAEPLLLRMHALLDAHGLPVDRAVALLERVARARSAAGDPLPTSTLPAEASDTPPPAEAETGTDDDVFPMPIESPAIATLTAPREPFAPVDDQPLRDAVALTDVLLRTTPRGVPIVPEKDVLSALPPSSRVGSLEALRAVVPSALSDAFPFEPELTDVLAQELQRDLRATLPSSSLGFAVEYGFTGYEEQHRATEDEVGAAADVLVGAVEHVEPNWRAAPPVPTPRSVRVILPSPVNGMPVVSELDEFGSPTMTTDSNDLHASERESPTNPRTERRPFGAALRAGRATAPQSSHGVLIAAALTLAAGSAAVWAYLHGGF